MVSKDQCRNNWYQMGREVQRIWGRITDSDLARAEGDYNRLVEMIQTRHGGTRQDIEQRVQELCNQPPDRRAA